MFGRDNTPPPSAAPANPWDPANDPNQTFAGTQQTLPPPPSGPPATGAATGAVSGEQGGSLKKAPKGEKPAKADKQAKEQAAPTTKSPASKAWPGPVKPSAVLVPRYVRERRGAKRTLRLVATGLVVLTVVLALAFVASFGYAKKVESDRNAAQATQASVKKQVDALNGVALYYDGLISRQEIAFATMKSDLDYTGLLNQVYEVADATGTSIENFGVLPSGSVCQASNPFQVPPSLGCLNVSVRFNDLGQISAFIDGINARPDYFHSAFAGAIGADGDAGQVVAVSMRYTSKALSLRYVPEDRKAEVIAQANTPAPTIDPATGLPVPAPATTGQAGAIDTTTPATTPVAPPAGTTPPVTPAG